MTGAGAQINPWFSRANVLACVALVAAIAYVLIKMTYLFLDDAAGATAPVVYGTASTSSLKNSSPSGQRVDTAALALFHLFGEQGSKAVAQAVPQDVSAPKTRLSLELQGVFVADDENRSTAMISEARKESQLYRIGDKVPGNASLAAVYADRVLLNLSGKLEALYFPDANAAGGLQAASRGPIAVAPPGTRTVSVRTGRVSSVGGQSVGGNVMDGANQSGIMPTAEQAEEAVRELKNQIGTNPDAVLSQFGLAANGGRGYRITDTSNPALSAIGARPGDVILTVNGRSVGDPAVDVEIIQEVMESGCVKVGVDRNGRQFSAEACPGQL